MIGLNLVLNVFQAEWKKSFHAITCEVDMHLLSAVFAIPPCWAGVSQAPTWSVKYFQRVGVKLKDVTKVQFEDLCDRRARLKNAVILPESGDDLANLDVGVKQCFQALQSGGGNHQHQLNWPLQWPGRTLDNVIIGRCVCVCVFAHTQTKATVWWTLRKTLTTSSICDMASKNFERRLMLRSFFPGPYRF